MKKILYSVSTLALILPFSLTANASGDNINPVPGTGDIALLASGVLIVICLAVFIFIKRRRR